MIQRGKPLVVVLTGAAGQIAYSLLHSLVNGSIFGEQHHIDLRLLDITPMLGALEGVMMELEDCALPLLAKVSATDDAQSAFRDADIAIMVGAMPRKEGMQRKDLLKANAGIFKTQGEALDRVAKKSIKVVVVGNPANTNAFIISHYAPSIPKENFSALTRLDENRARSLVARRLGVPIGQVSNVIIWGNHSNTQFPDVSKAKLAASPKLDVAKELGIEYYRDQFVKTIQNRGAAVIAARKLSSAMSAAKGVADHIRDWLQGTKPNEHVSMAICSDGSYGAPEGTFFSYPVTCSNGKWQIVQGLQLDEFARSMIEQTANELREERNEALAFLGASTSSHGGN